MLGSGSDPPREPITGQPLFSDSSQDEYSSILDDSFLYQENLARKMIFLQHVIRLEPFNLGLIHCLPQPFYFLFFILKQKKRLILAQKKGQLRFPSGANSNLNQLLVEGRTVKQRKSFRQIGAFSELSLSSNQKANSRSRSSTPRHPPATPEARGLLVHEA